MYARTYLASSKYKNYAADELMSLKRQYHVSTTKKYLPGILELGCGPKEKRNEWENYWKFLRSKKLMD